MYEVGTLVRLDLSASVLDALGLSADQHTHRVVGHDGEYLIIEPTRFAGWRVSRIEPDRVVVIETVDGTCDEIEHDPTCPVSKGYVRVCTCDPSRQAAQGDPRGERDR